ncbi:hypothetical protein BDW74DRAFT_146878 [Aspergillus multicolor]|uniref:ubiquinol-cytochrome c reductase complex assembly factor 2 n=1 Tax=Aspergillus multicolor TaxID=41759 RepID=UPI003CCD50FF
MAGTSTTAARLTRLAKQWPVDPIRPASVSVQTYLESRLSSLPQAQATAPKSSSTSTSPISESSLKALESLLENRYAKKYPLPENLRHPASNPSHYDDLLKEFEEAPNRDVMGRIWKRLGGILRLQ